MRRGREAGAQRGVKKGFISKAETRQIAKVNQRLEESATTQVNFVHHSKGQRGQSKSNTGSSDNKKKPKCGHCGWRNHLTDSCKYKNCRCNLCGVIGHLQSVCKKNNEINSVNSIFENNSNFSDFSTNSSSVVEDRKEFAVFTVNVENDVQINSAVNSVLSDDVDIASRLFVLPVEFAGFKLDITCDTGAPLSMMSIKMFDKFFNRSSLRHCSLAFTNYGGNRIEILGEFNTSIMYRGQSEKVTFVVTNTTNPPLLARNFLRKFNFELIQASQ